MHLLAQIVCQRARVSDIAGWYGPDHQRLGLLLPRTSREGGHRLIRDLEDRFHDRLAGDIARGRSLPRLSCDMFRYPPEGESDVALISRNAITASAP